MNTDCFQLEYCEPRSKSKQRIPVAEPVKILLEHPFKDSRWFLLRRMPDPGFYILCTVDGQVACLHESQFVAE